MKANLDQAAIDSLAEKLDEFAQVLTTDEQALLLAIFSLGSKALSEVGAQVESESGQLSKGAPKLGASLTTQPGRLGGSVLSKSLKDAFRPAIARGFSDLNVAADGVEVGGSIKWSK